MLMLSNAIAKQYTLWKDPSHEGTNRLIYLVRIIVFLLEHINQNCEYDNSERLILALNVGFSHIKHFNCNLNLTCKNVIIVITS